MVVGLDPRVEQGRAGALDAPYHAELLEQLERGVDRRQRHVRQAVGDGVEQLVGGDVAIELQQSAVKHDPLRGDPHAALT